MSVYQSFSDNLLARLERLETIRAKYEPLVKAEKNSERMAAVVGFLFGRPILTAKQLADGLNMPFKTARQYIEKLVQAGVLCEMTGYARNQIYRAEEIFGALDDSQD